MLKDKLKKEKIGFKKSNNSILIINIVIICVFLYVIGHDLWPDFFIFNIFTIRTIQLSETPKYIIIICFIVLIIFILLITRVKNNSKKVIEGIECKDNKDIGQEKSVSKLNSSILFCFLILLFSMIVKKFITLNLVYYEFIGISFVLIVLFLVIIIINEKYRKHKYYFEETRNINNTLFHVTYNPLFYNMSLPTYKESVYI